MTNITEKEINKLSVEQLTNLSKMIKTAQKKHRAEINKSISNSLNCGDQVEFCPPGTNKTQVGVIVKVKRVMVAIESIDKSLKWNIPLSIVGKKIKTAPISKSSTPSKNKTKTISSAKPKEMTPKSKSTKNNSVNSVNSTKSTSDVIKALREKINSKNEEKSENVEKTSLVL